jgi:7-cyano-7-deazaguanine synthase
MSTNDDKCAVVLFSGGLDSTTVLAIAQAEGFDVHALTFSYHQRHDVEVEVARRIASASAVKTHVVVDIDLSVFGGSALTSSEFEVPKHESADAIEDGIPITYVPARNTVFLSYALAYAEVVGASDIYIGVNALDYSGYPDCRPEYVAAFETMANLATKAGVEGEWLSIRAPLMEMTKAQIIERGTALGVDYGATHSCYDPSQGGLACGKCDSCLLRKKGFADAGVADPTRYQ